ncbi:MAG: hypothetical protein ACF8R7_13400 [Phycisphaerales bacterium JB039]
MDPQSIRRMTQLELAAHCARYPESHIWGDHRRYLDVAAAWPMWEAACHDRPTWVLRAQGDSVIVLARRPGADLVVVPSGAPAEAIQRAFLLSRIARPQIARP